MALSPTAVASYVVVLAIVLGCAAWVVRRYAVVAMVRGGLRVARVDAPSLAVGGLALAAGGVLVAAAADPEAPVRSAVLGLLVLTGAAGSTVAAANLDWYRAARSLPVVDAAAVSPGPVQVGGCVRVHEDPVASSVTRTDAVAYRAVTREERAVAGRGHAGATWVPTSVAFDAVPFGLVGADVVVAGDAAAYPLLSPTSRLVDLSPASATLEGLERTVPAEPGTTVPVGDDLDRGERPRPRRYSERRIDPGDEVYVLGTARETGDGLVVGDAPDGPPFLVVRCPAEEAIAHARQFVVGYGSIGLASLVAAAALAATML